MVQLFHNRLRTPLMEAARLQCTNTMLNLPAREQLSSTVAQQHLTPRSLLHLVRKVLTLRYTNRTATLLPLHMWLAMVQVYRSQRHIPQTPRMGRLRSMSSILNLPAREQLSSTVAQQRLTPRSLQHLVPKVPTLPYINRTATLQPLPTWLVPMVQLCHVPQRTLQTLQVVRLRCMSLIRNLPARAQLCSTVAQQPLTLPFLSLIHI